MAPKRIPLLLAGLVAAALIVATLWLRTHRDYWGADIDKFTQADAVQPPPRDAVLFIGSSSIVKWSTLAADFPGVPVINRGFGGSHLSDSVHYADRIAIPYHPRTVVLYAGDNDLYGRKGPKEVCNDYKAFAKKIHTALPQARLIFISIKPSPSRWNLRERIVQTNALIAAECAKDPRETFLDVYAPMLDASGQPRPELFVSDMLHMSAEGYAIWTRLLAPLLGK